MRIEFKTAALAAESIRRRAAQSDFTPKGALTKALMFHLRNIRGIMSKVGVVVG